MTFFDFCAIIILQFDAMKGGDSMSNVIYLNDIKDQRYKEAYEWALSDSVTRGIKPSPARMEWNDDEDYDRSVILITLFYNPESGRALLRRDWIKEPFMQYNVITNFEEVKRTAPNVVREMITAGLELKKKQSLKCRFYH